MLELINLKNTSHVLNSNYEQLLINYFNLHFKFILKNNLGFNTFVEEFSRDMNLLSSDKNFNIIVESLSFNIGINDGHFNVLKDKLNLDETKYLNLLFTLYLQLYNKVNCHKGYFLYKLTDFIKSVGILNNNEIYNTFILNYKELYYSKDTEIGKRYFDMIKKWGD